MAANNKRNVSTTRGVKGGYFFSAPIGTTDVPTKATALTWSPGDAWENQGYIVEDGFTESVQTDSETTLRDINGDAVDTEAGARTESVEVGFMENAKNPLATQYGHANVTDENGVLEVRHNWGNADEHRMYVFLLLLKNGRKWVKFIPDGKVSELGDLTGNHTTVAQRTATISYLTDDEGNGCYDWYESTETPAPQASTISLSGGTLNPTFSAAVREYTATATGSSVTVTVTPGTGKTASIRSGENTYSSGSAIPVVTGTNKIVVTVTHTESGAQGTYTIIVTKS